jgi:uncharacterized protein
MQTITTDAEASELILPIAETAQSNGHTGSEPNVPHPVETADRIKTIDVVRGFALLGILLMNIPVFGIDFSALFGILEGPKDSADYRTTAVVFSVFDGTMRGLFSMLFGAGMVLFTLNKKEIPGGVTVAEYYYRRLLWLVLFGVINAFVFLWQGDILFYYGLLGMLLYPFRKTKPKWLIALAIVCMSVGALKTMLGYNEMRDKRAKYLQAVAAEKSNKKLTSEQVEAKAAWLDVEKYNKVDTARAGKNIRKMHESYGTIFNYFIDRNANNETWGMYHGMWDMISMMFVGMALFGLGFFSNKLSTSTYSLTLLVGYGLGIPMGWLLFKNGFASNINIAPYIDHYRVPDWVLYDVRRGLIAVGHASLLLLIFRSKLVPWLMKALACVGQMAFTNYLMQSIICTLIFHGYGFGYYNNIKFHQLYYIVGSVWIFQMIFSVIWLRYFRFGPFEWLWRSLTYWKPQPMRLQTIETRKEVLV